MHLSSNDLLTCSVGVATVTQGRRSRETKSEPGKNSRLPLAVAEQVTMNVYPESSSRLGLEYVLLRSVDVHGSSAWKDRYPARNQRMYSQRIPRYTRTRRVHSWSTARRKERSKGRLTVFEDHLLLLVWWNRNSARWCVDEHVNNGMLLAMTFVYIASNKLEEIRSMLHISVMHQHQGK